MHNLSFNWIPGHSNIEGNEAADRAARESAITEDTATVSIPISWKSTKPLLENYYLKKWEYEWNESNPKITKEFFPTATAAKILNNINVPHHVIQILTGHCRLNKYLHSINAIDDPLCQCGTDIESVKPFLFHCPLYHTQRIPLKNTLQKHCNHRPPPLNIITNCTDSLRALGLFCVSTRRLDFD